MANNTRISNCRLFPDYRLLNALCKIECNYYSTDIKMSELARNIGKWQIFQYKYETNVNIIWILSPKMDLIVYLSTIGGLMGMWLGFSAYTIVTESLDALRVV